MIPYGRHDINQADIDAVVNVLQSDWLTQGPMVPRFELAIAQKVGAKHVVAVNSATSALHIACLALNLGPGDWLWTSPNTFVASANCGLYCGAKVDFVDIDPSTYNMSVETLTKKLEQAEQLGVLPKVVVPVHFAGQSCDMARIHALSQRYGFKVIEDASHAIGGMYRNELIGNCRYSDITVFSFHPVKIITSGEGGVVLTNDSCLAEKMAMLRSHGITRDTNHFSRPTQGSWYYEQQLLGYNYRMTDIQAALGISQLDRLDEFVVRRNQIAARYNELLAGQPMRLPVVLEEGYSSFHLYVVRLHLDKIKGSHREVFEGLRAAGIGVNLHYIPVHQQPFYQKLGFKGDECPNAEQYYAEAISLPMFPALTEQQQVNVASCLAGILRA